MENNLKKKNITLFLNAFWNNGKGMSGGDQMLIQIFKRIRSNFNFVSCYTNIDGKKVISDDVKDVNFFISSEFFDRFPLIINYFFRTIQSFKIVFKKDIDIIYSGSDFFPDVVPAFLYKIFHPKTKWFQCIFHIYPNWSKRPGNKFKNFVAQYLQKFSFLFVKKADKIININYQVKEDLIRKNFKKEKIFVNTPGIDLDYFKNLKIPKGIKKYDATFLARLSPSKGIFDLVEIWEKIVDKIPNAKLAIMGGGSNEIKNSLKKIINKKGLGKNIDVLGFMENDQAFSIIKNSKVFLFPSHEEGFGIAIAEAMACEVPVISWNLPVYREVFENYLIQVEENEFQSFTDNVVELLKDEDKRKIMISNAINFVKKYSWEFIAEKQLKILIY